MKRPAVFIVLFALFIGISAPALAQDVSPVASPDGGPSLLAGLGFDELVVTGTDDGLEVATEVAAGRYHLVFDNQSSVYASVDLYKVPDGMTPDELVAAFEAAGDSEEAPAIFYEVVLNGGAAAESWGSGDVILDLDAGEWLFVYNSYNEETDEEINFPATVTVTGEAPAPADVPTDVTVEMFEMEFAFTSDIGVKAGPHIWEVLATGEQPHFMLLSRYPEPFTADEAMAMLETAFAPPASPEVGATPVTGADAGLDFELFEDVYETGVLSSGQTNWVVIDLEPGFYGAICFISDIETGAPHAMLGMIETFEVTE